MSLISSSEKITQWGLILWKGNLFQTILFWGSSNKIRKDPKWASEHGLSKFDQSISYEFKADFLVFWCLYHLLFDLETSGGILNHHLMANIWEKAISILSGNLNSGLHLFNRPIKNCPLGITQILALCKFIFNLLFTFIRHFFKKKIYALRLIDHFKVTLEL